MLTRYNPFGFTLDRFFNNTLPARSEFVFSPAIDLVEEEDHFALKADLPGVAEEDIELSVKDGVLTLSGNREQHKETERDGTVYSERRYGSFSRSVRLGEAVDTAAIEANFENGVLTVTLPKRAEVKPRTIKIRNGN